MRQPPRTFAILLAASLAAAAFAQEPTSPGREEKGPRFDPPRQLQPIERFEGRIRLRGAEGQGPDSRVVMRTWIIPNRQRIEQFPERGLVLVQVRGGTVVTLIGGERKERRTDEFFTVPEDTPFGVETGQDSVILQTTSLQTGDVIK